MLALVWGRIVSEEYEPEAFAAVGLYLAAAALCRAGIFSPVVQFAYRQIPDSNSDGGLENLRKWVHSAIAPKAAIIVLCSIAISVLGLLDVIPAGSVALLVSGWLILEVVQTVETNFLTGLKQHREVALCVIFAGVARIALFLVLVRISILGESSYFVAMLLGSALTFLLARSRTIRLFGMEQTTDACKLPDRSGECTSSWEELAASASRYARPLGVLAIVSWVHSMGGRFLVDHYAGALDAGHYIAAYGVVSQVSLLIDSALQQLMQPVYHEGLSRGEVAKAKSVFDKWLKASLLLSLMMCAFFLVFGDYVVKALLAPEYSASSKLVAILAPGLGMLAVAHVYEWDLYARRRTDLVLKGHVVSSLVCMIATPPLASLYGGAGAAWSTWIYYGVYLWIMRRMRK